MQPQDNTFPIDDVASEGDDANNASSDQQNASQPIGGDTFQPQPLDSSQTPDLAGANPTETFNGSQDQTTPDAESMNSQPDTTVPSENPLESDQTQASAQPNIQSNELPQSSTAEPTNVSSVWNTSTSGDAQPEAAPSAGQNDQYTPAQDQSSAQPDMNAQPMPEPTQSNASAYPDQMGTTTSDMIMPTSAPVSGQNTQPNVLPEQTFGQQNQPGLDQSSQAPGQPTFAPPPDFGGVQQPEQYQTSPTMPEQAPAQPTQYEAPGIPSNYSEPPNQQSDYNYGDATQGPVPTPQEPYYTQDPAYAEPNAYGAVSQQDVYGMPQGLPGSDQLGNAAVSMEGLNPQQGYYPDGSNFSDLGAQPTADASGNQGIFGSNKKLFFIIGGALIGLIIIIISIILVSQSSNKAATPAPTPTPTPTPKPAPETPAATPPAGYVTISKQCYSFAIVEPNKVPTDNACSFDKSTFGKKDISTIEVQTYTDNYNNLSSFVETFKPNITLVSEKDTKLDNIDAKQLIYKDVDGITYSKILALTFGKNYQQEGKAVNGIEITTTYQDVFDKEVLPNIIDTWRWK